MRDGMHKIERAIIVAAGIGERLHPVTLRMPKPLVPVNGVRMIDTIIDALHANGIREIYVVVGYLKEQFSYLERIDGITLIGNPYYDVCNNISSLYVARDHLENVIILDGDQVIYRPEVRSASFARSGYCAAWTDAETKEWLLTVKDGVVTSCARDGGKNGYRLYSISRWTARDGEVLKRCLEEEFEKKQNRDIYWDDVPVSCHPGEFSLGICEIDGNDVLEIDNMDELVAVDATYREMDRRVSDAGYSGTEHRRRKEQNRESVS